MGRKKKEVVDGRRTSEKRERESSPFAIGIQKEPWEDEEEKKKSTVTAFFQKKK